MKVNRRAFLKMVGATSSAALMGGPAKARAGRRAPRSGETLAMLIDTTRCIGCRSCEMACNKANGLPTPERLGQPSVFDARRATRPDAFTVVNRYADPKNGRKPAFVKSQCMHCVEPACA